MFRYTYIDKQGNLLCDVSEYVRKHNVVYKTPVKKKYDGLPLGNGFMGGLVYHTDRELCMRIGRTDTFDYSNRGNFGAWGHEWEEKCTTLANNGLLKISDGTPAFAWEYMDDYNMTLDLGRSQIDMASKTPFSQYTARGYGSFADKCIVWEAEATSEEPVSRTISLERYGTRGFFHDYEAITRDTSRRLYNIQTSIKDNCMLVTQQLNGCTFTTAIKVEAEGSEYVIHNKREVSCVLPAAMKAVFKIFITTTCTYDDEDTEAMATAILRDAATAPVYENHLNWWKEYWNRSFVSIENDFLENVYYMNRYQFGCCGFGTFPPTVFGSLWTTCGDAHNWGHFYHWNDQQQFWPCDSWNHPELLKSYFDYRRRMLPNAIKDGKALHGIDGAWYSDITSPEGYQAAEPDTQRNMCCGPMLSLQMYRHYKHFPDKDFLLNTAYPVMKACGDTYLHLLEKEADGKYHIHDVTPMEGYLYLDDTTADWALAQALFRALLDVAEDANAPEELKAAWLDKLENLFDPQTYELDGKTVLAYGRSPDGSARITHGYPEGGMALSGVGALMCVFPGSDYGLYTTHRKHYDIVKNTIDTFSQRLSRIGWDTINECLARFGMTDNINRNLDDFIQQFVIFPNGLTHYNPKSYDKQFIARIVPEGTDHTPWGDMHEKDKGERIVYDPERFIHFYSEPEGCIGATINDSLLQSWEGIIRVFPAANDGIFRLHAEGDFMVTSQKTDGIVRFVAIESRRSGTVTLASPFEEAEYVRCDMKAHPYALTEQDGQRLISFDTEPGKQYVIFSRAMHIDGSYPTCVPVACNTAPKKCGKRIIGLERDF